MVSVSALRDVVAAAAEVDAGVLRDIISRATAYVETRTRRRFQEVEEITEYLSGTGTCSLRLPETVVIEDEDYPLMVEQRPYPGATATVITAFEVRPSGTRSKLVRTDGNVWIGGYEYAVTFSRGYNEDEGPKDIEQVVIDLVSLRLALRGKDALQGETIGGYSYTKQNFSDSELNSIPGAEAIIKAWRLPVLGA